jgi:TonB family protein
MNFSHLSATVCLSIFLVFPSQAPVPSKLPETPAAKVAQPANPLSPTSLANPKPPQEPQPDILPNLPALATEIAKYAAVKDCLPKPCTVLVTNFLLPDGDTSRYGIQLADHLSRDLATQGHNIQVTDRGLLQDLLIKDRVPGKFMEGTGARLFALKLKSTFFVVGDTQLQDDGTVLLSVTLLDSADKDWRGYTAVVNLPAPKSGADLAPSEPFSDLPPFATTASGETVILHGGPSPACFYMPGPPYSDEARKLKVSGYIITEAIINTQGTLESLRISRGLPGGLNETTLATMRTWRCHPAQLDGKNVPVQLRFELNFRLY